jgi:hypothetical protein
MKNIVVKFVATLCRNKTPGLEFIAFSRSPALECLVILDKNEITYDTIMKIVKGK